MVWKPQRQRQKRWRETTIIGRQSIETKHKAREWVTLYQHSGISLQLNPSYYEFRLWLFTQYGNVAVELDRSKVTEIAKALGVARFLISNVPSHEGTAESPHEYRFKLKMTRGERTYLTRQINRYLTGIRSRKRLKQTQTGV